MYFNLYAIPVFIVVMIMLALVIAVWQYRSTPGVKCFAVVMLAGSVYSLFYALEISSDNLQLIETFYKLEYLGIPLIPAFYLLFAIRYSGRKERLKIHYLIAVLAIPVLTMLLVFTNSYHSLFISGGHIDKHGLYPAYSFTPEIWYWVHQVYSIATIIISSVLFVILLINSAPAFRKQVSIILLASFFPFTTYLVYLMGKFPWGLDPIPFAFSITGLVAFAGISRYRLFNLAPLARNQLFEKIPDAVLVFDDKARLIDCNHAAAKLLNIAQSDFGNPAKDILVQYPELFSFFQFDKPCESHVITLNINDKTRFFDCFCSSLLDKHQKIRGKMLVMHDITLQHTSELKRREIEEKFRLIFENAPLGVLYFDKNGIIKVCNDYFVGIIGSSREKLIGLNLLQLHDERVVEAVKGVLQGRKGFFEGDYQSVTAIKTTPVRAIFDTIRKTNGELEGGFGIVEDITDRIEAEEKIKSRNIELQRLNAEKDRFFSIIAHDLRSPFNTLLGFAELIADQKDEATADEMRVYANEIKKSALMLFGLLENLLEWSKLQKEAIDLKLNLLSLHDIVYQTIVVLSQTSEKKEINITNNIDRSFVVVADEKMLSSAFRNLISNAIKFTNRGGKVSIDSSKLNNNMIQVMVSDNGIGIPKDKINKLFKIDEKTGTPGTEGEPSSGLGLILCKEFINLMGGEIFFESEAGKGSTFYFTIPFASADMTPDYDI